MTRKIEGRREFLQLVAKTLELGSITTALAGCGIFKSPPTADQVAASLATMQAPKPVETPKAAPANADETPQARKGEASVDKEDDLPYFSIKGATALITLQSTDDRLANNGPDRDGNDHRNPYMPIEAGFLAADPGHYRVDNITNVTDPVVRASIERDVKNGAAYAGNDYKKVLTAEDIGESFPLMESGGAAMFTTAQIELDFADAEDNTINIQCGRQPKHAWIAVVQNGLNRDNMRDTEVNRTVHASHYDAAWTMWQATPPGSFVSAKFISQTVADAHKTYRDRGTAPGAGLDGVTNVSLLLVKILPEGAVFQVYQHNDLGKWEEYKPADFKPYAGNLKIS